MSSLDGSRSPCMASTRLLTFYFHLFPSFQDGYEPFPNHPSAGSSQSGKLDTFFKSWFWGRSRAVVHQASFCSIFVGRSNRQDHSKPQGSDDPGHPDGSPDATAGTAGSFTTRLVRLRYVIVRPPQATGIFIADFVAISHRKYMIYVYIYNIDNYWYIGIYIYICW